MNRISPTSCLPAVLPKILYYLPPHELARIARVSRIFCRAAWVALKLQAGKSFIISANGYWHPVLIPETIGQLIDRVSRTSIQTPPSVPKVKSNSKEVENNSTFYDIEEKWDEDIDPSAIFAEFSFFLNKTKYDHLVSLVNLLQGEGDLASKEQVLNEILQMADVDDVQRYQIKLLRCMENYPTLLLNMIKQYKLPCLETIQMETRALEQIANSAEQDAEKARDEAIKLRLSQIQSKANELLDEIAVSSRQRVDQSKSREKELKKEWIDSLKRFYEQAVTLKFNRQKGIFSKKELSDFVQTFHSLRCLKPSSIAPFLPYLTILAGRMDEELLKTIMLEAQKCDFYLTYVIPVCFSYLLIGADHKLGVYLYNPVSILNVIKSIYPADIFTPSLITAVEANSEKAFLGFQNIDECLRIVLNHLSSDLLDQAVQVLIQNKKRLIGFSVLYNYLAIAYALQNKPAKARDMLKRTLNLFDFCEHKLIFEKCYRFVAPILSSTYNDAKISSPNNPSYDLLEKFLQLMSNSQSLDCFVAKEFVDLSCKVLQSDSKQFPIVYLGIQWIASKLVISRDGFGDFRQLWESVGNLMTVTASYVFMYKGEDKWIYRKFKRIINENNENAFKFSVNFRSLTFNAQSVYKPKFIFKNLKLTKSSVISVAISLTKQIYNLFLGIMCSNSIVDFVERKGEKLKLVDNSTVFLTILHSGIISRLEKNGHRSFLFDLANSYLEEYLNQSNYFVSQSILDWATYCIFSFKLPEYCSEKLKERIYDFYPIIREFDDAVKMRSVKNFLNQILIIANQDFEDVFLELGLRDAFLAANRLKIRSNDSFSELSNDVKNIYSIFNASQCLFGWHAKESFEKWISRLKAENETGIAAPDYKASLESSIQIPSSGYCLSEALLDKRDILRSILIFWLNFQDKTQAKNLHIANDGDENQPEIRYDSLSKGLSDKELEQIVKNNTPALHPQFKKLVNDKSKKNFIEIINRKHEHYLAVQKLKSLEFKSQEKEPMDFAISMAAVLITAAEYDRDQGTHSIFVEDKETAKLIYQILLDVAIDRLVRRALIVAGPNSWTAFDCAKIMSILLPELSRLEGAFHGPETHSSGDAPLHIHYNAGVLTSTNSLINTHIFFNDPEARFS